MAESFLITGTLGNKYYRKQSNNMSADFSEYGELSKYSVQKVGKLNTNNTGDPVSGSGTQRGYALIASFDVTNVIRLINMGATVFNVTLTWTYSSPSGSGCAFSVGRTLSATAPSIEGRIIKTSTTTSASNAISQVATTSFTNTNFFPVNEGNMLYYAIGGAVGGSSFEVTITKVTLNVELNIPSYKLTIAVNNDLYGTVSADKTDTQKIGTESEITAIPKNNCLYTHTFSEWSLEGGGTLDSTTDNPTTYTFAASDGTVTGSFTQTEHFQNNWVKNKYSVNGGNTWSEGDIGGTTSHSLNSNNETLSLTTSPEIGFEFDGYEIRPDTAGSITDNIFTPSNDSSTVIIYALYKAKAGKITTSINTTPATEGSDPQKPGGTISPTKQEETIYYSNTITFTATEATPFVIGNYKYLYQFKEWGANVGTFSDSNALVTTYTYTYDSNDIDEEDIIITAYFNEIQRPKGTAHVQVNGHNYYAEVYTKVNNVLKVCYTYYKDSNGVIHECE